MAQSTSNYSYDNNINYDNSSIVNQTLIVINNKRRAPQVRVACIGFAAAQQRENNNTNFAKNNDINITNSILKENNTTLGKIEDPLNFSINFSKININTEIDVNSKTKYYKLAVLPWFNFDLNLDFLTPGILVIVIIISTIIIVLLWLFKSNNYKN